VPPRGAASPARTRIGRAASAATPAGPVPGRHLIVQCPCRVAAGHPGAPS